MRKLLSAGFARLWRNKVFWAGHILISGVIILAMLSNYREQQQYYDFTYTSDTFIPGCYMFIGCFTAVFAALFLGTEYSDGTIRNKLIAGHTRASLYLSSLILTLAASLLVSTVSVLLAAAVGIPLFGPPVNIPLLLEKIGVGSLLVLSFAALFTFLAMLIHNKSLLSVTAVLTFFLLLFAALFGLYPMVKSAAEKPRKRVLGYAVKLAFFNAAFTILYLTMAGALLASLPPALGGALWVLYPAANVVFLLYDYGFSQLIAAYLRRVGRAVR